MHLSLTISVLYWVSTHAFTTTWAYPSCLLYTRHTDSSITQHFHHFTCSTSQSIHIPGVSSEDPTLLQFIISTQCHAAVGLGLPLPVCHRHVGVSNGQSLPVLWMPCFWISLVQDKDGNCVDGAISVGLPSQVTNSHQHTFHSPSILLDALPATTLLTYCTWEWRGALLVIRPVTVQSLLVFAVVYLNVSCTAFTFVLELCYELPKTVN